MSVARALGVDLGRRRIGLALSDPSRTAATPHRVLERSDDRGADHEAVLDEAREAEVDTIVVGLPLTLEGEVGTAARRTLSEVDELRTLAGPEFRVVVHDERLTTVTAEAAMVEAGVRRRRRRENVDRVAAAVILQSWLDADRQEDGT